MKQARKTTAFLLTVIMVLGLVPGLNALAADETGNIWRFTRFGVSTNAACNRLLPNEEGVEDIVSLSSAVFKEDGSVSSKGGKFVADSPADGGSYYYTDIDPTRQNFVLQADVTLDQLNPAPDGQEGFALMVRDAIFPDDSGGSCMANLFSVTGTKLPTGGVNTGTEVKDTIGVRAYSGIRMPEASDENMIWRVRYGGWKDENGNSWQIAQGDTYRVRLEKTD